MKVAWAIGRCPLPERRGRIRQSRLWSGLVSRCPVSEMNMNGRGSIFTWPRSLKIRKRTSSSQSWSVSTAREACQVLLTRAGTNIKDGLGGGGGVRHLVALGAYLRHLVLPTGTGRGQVWGGGGGGLPTFTSGGIGATNRCPSKRRVR